ncbi:porin family protein [Photobacterium sanctipauli]|uniref:Porin family protein n=1 Tax=Photobacterium sanctipauli TaxID=1342794 RepID=A0A2T3NX21_9GAMM|nr:porin family protein [Photobacterium sanctipauli]PSW20847.1 porin family protein [Photobacterium sanctipauli]
MKKLAAVVMALGLSAPVSADILGLSVGAHAGGARVEYDGESDNGFEYGINASYHFNDLISANVGVVQGSADVDANGVTNDIDYTAFPLTLRADIPLLIGSVYAKAGTNYYDYDIDTPGNRDSDDGWGFTGGAGVVFTMLPFIDLSLGYEYRDMGDVTNNAIMFGIGASL